MELVDAPRAYFVAYSLHNGYRITTVQRFRDFIYAAAPVMAQVWTRYIAPSYHGVAPADIPRPSEDLAAWPQELRSAFDRLVSTVAAGLERTVTADVVNRARRLRVARPAPGGACGFARECCIPLLFSRPFSPCSIAVASLLLSPPRARMNECCTCLGRRHEPARLVCATSVSLRAAGRYRVPCKPRAVWRAPRSPAEGGDAGSDGDSGSDDERLIQHLL